MVWVSQFRRDQSQESSAQGHQTFLRNEEATVTHLGYRSVVPRGTGMGLNGGYFNGQERTIDKMSCRDM